MKQALFGGAFNPIHNDHIGMTNFLLENGYDRVILAPSNNPPHKICTMDYDERVKMLELAFANDERVKICQLEKTLNDINYSYQTIPLYETIFGKFDFVIGGDSLIDLHKWMCPEKVVEQVNLIVFNRGNRDIELQNAFNEWTEKGANITILDWKGTDISSSRVRLEASLGFVRDVPENVAQYIDENDLYYKKDLLDGIKLPSDIAVEMSKQLSSFRYEHVLRTALYALKLNKLNNLGLDPNKILLAGILHDCAKEDPDFQDEEIPMDTQGTLVWHQFAGAVKAKNHFYVQDDEILDAIRYHCTGKADMTQLQKLIYTADMLEPKSKFSDPNEKARLISIVEDDFEIGFVETLKQSYNHLLSKNKPIYPLTKEAVDFYTK